jgi:phosphoribosylaminoimidazole (AIR) synthetase
LSFFLKGRLPYENDNRIDDEKRLEDYFLSLGFEIVYPDEFKSFEEQMNFFYSAKTVASLTGSGLTNACFMQPGSTVIEICTPLISFTQIGNGVTDHGSVGQEEIHHFYNVISTMMDHNYIAIQNMSRSSEHVIQKIENNKSLKKFLES